MARRMPLALAAVATLASTLLVGIHQAQAATSLPCDIYSAGGTNQQWNFRS